MPVSYASVLSVTFASLHALHKDAPALWQHPVTALVAVLAEHHGAQRVGRLKQLPSDLTLLLERENTNGIKAEVFSARKLTLIKKN